MDMVLAGAILLLIVFPLAAFLMSVAIGRGWAWGRGEIIVVHKTSDEYDLELKRREQTLREQLDEPDDL